VPLKKIVSRYAAIIASLFLVATTVIATHMPLSNAQKSWIGQKDKIFHFLIFGAICFCLCHALKLIVQSFRLRVAIAFVMLVAFGIVDEWMQSFTASRTASGWDLLADFLGAFFGASCYAIGVIMIRRRSARIVAGVES
jgi:VanZ family protein